MLSFEFIFVMESNQSTVRRSFVQLLEVWWLDIGGMVNILPLSPNTQYAAYLVFKMIDAKGF
jgi:hypothetical protein